VISSAKRTELQLPFRVNGAVVALRESFERFEEDYAEEQFFTAARAAYWAAPEGSPVRDFMADLIDKLEF